VPLDVIVRCAVEYVDTDGVGVGKLSTYRDIVCVTVDEAHCDDETILDTLRMGVVEELIDRIDGDRDGLTVAESVCI
jgi:hypothetical protein